MKDVKIIANYLPQFHSIPENDEWWGKGYTDWDAVRRSKPLYSGHNQPRVPHGEHYYKLDNSEEIRRQAKLAREYGIFGFGIYHYWFSSELHLLDKPAILLNESKDIDINYMFIWDNGSWKRTWSNVKFGNDWSPLHEDEKSLQKKGTGILAELKYGDKDEWEKHFIYLLQFFKDERYIKIDNKPVFAFYNQNNEPEVLKEMCEYWDDLAKKEGFAGIYCLGKRNNQKISIMDYGFLYQPEWDGWLWHNLFQRAFQRLKTEFYRKVGKPIMYSYDSIWRRILRTAKQTYKEDLFYSAFVAYDDTPRRGKNGRVVKGDTPKKFQNYLRKLIEISKANDKEYLFLTAWNEWGEGAYLEPDTQNEFSYLEAVKKAVEGI